MSIYDYSVRDGSGNDVSLSAYRDRVLLIVNTATKCGLTPQYEALESLYKEFTERGFEILDFPSNQFLKQAPGTDEEISTFCEVNYGTTFPRFAKVDVNGKDADPLFTFLKFAARNDADDAGTGALYQTAARFRRAILGDNIKWNFTKFLVNRDGEVVARFGPTVKPGDIEARIEELL